MKLVVTTNELLNKTKGLVSFCFILFLIGVLFGLLSYDKSDEQLPEMLKDAFEGVIDESSSLKTSFNILVRNLNVTLITIAMGFTLVIPLLIVIINGFFAGVSIGFALENLGVHKLIVGVLPHSIFEIPAFIIAAALGCRIGITLFLNRNKKETITNIKGALLVYLTVVVPLLIVATFVESFISARLLLLFP